MAIVHYDLQLDVDLRLRVKQQALKESLAASRDVTMNEIIVTAIERYLKDPMPKTEPKQVKKAKKEPAATVLKEETEYSPYA